MLFPAETGRHRWKGIPAFCHPVETGRCPGSAQRLQNEGRQKNQDQERRSYNNYMKGERKPIMRIGGEIHEGIYKHINLRDIIFNFYL